MTKICIGCGARLQDLDKQKEGYAPKLEETTVLCERCFRINHYHDYQMMNKTNHDFYPILERIALKESLVVFVLDLFSLPKDLSFFDILRGNPVFFVITKRDLFSKTTYDENLLSFLETYHFPYIDVCLVSSKKNYQFDLLYEKIQQYQNSKEVYVIGYTNAGKSTLINRMIQNYGNQDLNLTTSILPSTTLDENPIYLTDSLTLIDTPGILEENSLISKIDIDDLKEITPSKEIRPITFQIKQKQQIEIGKFAKIEALPYVNLTLYVSNKIAINRNFKDMEVSSDYHKWELSIKEASDIVILGLGFIHVSKACKFTVFVIDGVDVFVRKALVGRK